MLDHKCKVQFIYLTYKKRELKKALLLSYFVILITLVGELGCLTIFTVSPDSMFIS